MRSGERPCAYTDELALTICDRIAEGKILHSVCADPAMPDRATVLDWLDHHPKFRAQYDFAQAFFTDDLAYECIEIVDSDISLSSARLRCDVRWWLIARMERKKGGKTQ